MLGTFCVGGCLSNWLKDAVLGTSCHVAFDAEVLERQAGHCGDEPLHHTVCGTV